MVEVAGRIKMKPRWTGNSGLETAVIWNGDDQASARLQDPANLSDRPKRIDEVLQNVPQDDLVKPGIRVENVLEVFANADCGPRIGTRGSCVTDLESVDFESTLSQR